MARKNFIQYYLGVADSVAARSTCLKRNYGAVIVKNSEIIATGYNGAARGCKSCDEVFDICPRINEPSNGNDYSTCKSVHSEMNCIISAARKDMIGATMYLFGRLHSTGEVLSGTTCCEVCKRLIINAGIDEVIVADPQGIAVDATTGYRYRTIKVRDWVEENHSDK